MQIISFYCNNNTSLIRMCISIPRVSTYKPFTIVQWCILLPTMIYLVEYVHNFAVHCVTMAPWKLSWTLVFYRLVCLWNVWAIFWRLVSWIRELFSGTLKLLQVHVNSYVDLLLCLSASLSKYIVCVCEFTVCFLSQVMNFQYQWLMEPSHGMRLRDQPSQSKIDCFV